MDFDEWRLHALERPVLKGNSKQPCTRQRRRARRRRQEDHLVEDNRAFHRALEDMRVPHEYRALPGGHDWDYWDLHVRDALAFHARALGLAGAVT